MSLNVEFNVESVDNRPIAIYFTDLNIKKDAKRLIFRAVL